MRSGISLISLFLILLYRTENIPQELMFFKHFDINSGYIVGKKKHEITIVILLVSSEPKL